MTAEPTQRPAIASFGVAGDEARVLAIAVAAWLGAATGLRLPSGSGLPMLVAVATAGAVVAAVVVGRGLGRACVVAVAGLVAVFGLAGIRAGLAARAYQVMEPAGISAEGVVRTDPEPIGSGWRLELKLRSGERLEATAFGRAGFEMRRLTVGDEVRVDGRVRPLGERPWLRSRHIVGRLSVGEVTLLADAAGLNRMVNGLRSVIAAGAVSFDDRVGPLYTGLVIGDDRFQPLSQRAQFRASGLTHLLAVSGQNVAFVLLVVRPLLMVLSRRLRLTAVVAVLVIFAAMTRAEPSVLRAATGAGVATWALLTGRTGSGLRALAAGVAALVMIDPFLIDVVGFQLSVAASAGIIVISPLIVARLPATIVGVPGGTAVAQALAVTVGAQVAVAPLLIQYFGPLPLASIPANLLAGWAAGLVMTLGLTVGPVSGFLHQARLPTVAALIQRPSGLLVEWIDGVARWSSDLDLPRLGPRSFGSLLVLGVIVALRPRGPVSGLVVKVSAAAVAVGLLAAARTGVPNAPTVITDEVLLLPSGSNEEPTGGVKTVSVMIVSDPSPSAIDELLASNVQRVDVLISERGDARAAAIVTALSDVVDVDTILAPPRHRIRGATSVTGAVSVPTVWGPVFVDPDASGSGLVVVVPPDTSGSGRPSPVGG